MKASELKKYIHELIKDRLLPLGFRKHDSWYYKNEIGFTTSIIISSLNYDNSFPTSFSIAYGFVGVDKILLMATSSVNEANKCKIGGQIFIRQQELFEKGKYRIKDYDIYTFEQANEAVKESLEYLLDTIIEENKQYNSNENIERKINGKGNFDNDRFLPNNLKYGLILAKLVKNPEYEDLKNKYRELLKNWSDWDKQELEKVINFIDSHSQEELQKISETA